jgi:hypothetical protein
MFKQINLCAIVCQLYAGESVYLANNTNPKIKQNITEISNLLSCGKISYYNLFVDVTPQMCKKFLLKVQDGNIYNGEATSYNIYSEYKYINVKQGEKVICHIQFINSSIPNKIEELIK